MNNNIMRELGSIPIKNYNFFFSKIDLSSFKNLLVISSEVLLI